MRMWKRPAAYALLALMVATLFAVLALNVRLQGPARLEKLIRQSMAYGPDDDHQLNRWASSFDVCIYGGRLARTTERTELFFEMVKEATWLVPTLFFEPEIIDCPDRTFMYIRLHQGNAKLLETIVGELSFIMRRAGMTKPMDASFNEYGMGLVMVEPGKEPRLYAAINEFEGAATDVDKSMARNVVQQELLQILLNARDVEVTYQPVSIVEERHVPNVPDDEDDADPQHRVRRASLNVPNMCLYDVMLLMTLYARDESIIMEAKLGSYIRYIRSNYPALEHAARQIQDNPRYRDIFASKC